MLDKIKSLGYKYSTRAALTVSISDMEIPKEKKRILQKPKKLLKITKKYRRGFMTDDERHNKSNRNMEYCQ